MTKDQIYEIAIKYIADSKKETIKHALKIFLSGYRSFDVSGRLGFTDFLTEINSAPEDSIKNIMYISSMGLVSYAYNITDGERSYRIHLRDELITPDNIESLLVCDLTVTDSLRNALNKIYDQRPKTTANE